MEKFELNGLTLSLLYQQRIYFSIYIIILYCCHHPVVSSEDLISSLSPASSSLASSTTKQQHFLIKPNDIEIIEGDTAEIQCNVGNQVGAVQWAKDGLLLGMPRYRMISDSAIGKYNLRITSVTIEDEGEYQCQVGPAQNQLPIRASSQLTVIVPPKSLTITGSVSPESDNLNIPIPLSSSSSLSTATAAATTTNTTTTSSTSFSSSSSSSSDHHILEAKESEKVILLCLVSPSKPPPRVKWFRKNIELLPEASRTHHNKSMIANRYTLYTTESSIILYPKSEGTYSCEIEHPGLSKPLRASSMINIFNEPGPPLIEGYSESESIILLGDPVTLTCTSRGGYPHPRVYWLRNDLEIDKSYNVNSRSDVINTYSFTPTIEDNQSIFKCSVTSNLTTKPLEATIKLNVNFLPSKVTITGPSETRLYKTIDLKCITRPGNPPPLLTWLVDGNSTTPSTIETQNDGTNGWIIKSTLSYTISTRTPSVIFTCKAEGVSIHRKSISTNHQVNIIYPPNSPTLTGYKDNLPMESGSVHKIKCVSLGGNPPPNLKWYKQGKEISTISSVSGSGVSNELVIRPEPSDNGLEYICQVNHPALSQPYSISFTLNVIYSANISEPIKVRRAFGKTDQWPAEGDDNFQLLCLITSNPEPRVKWFREDNGPPMDWFRVKYSLESRSGHYVSILTVYNVTRSDSGLYMCSAHNSLNLVASVQTIRVSVEYAPNILIKRNYRKVAAEVNSDLVKLTCQADGYPVVHFNWSVGGVENSFKYKIINETIQQQQQQPNDINNSNNQTTANNLMVNVNFSNNNNQQQQITNRYNVNQPINPVNSLNRFQSNLIIYNLMETDFGSYRCIAYNYLGQDIFDIELVRKSIPEAPVNLTLVNITHNSLTISWVPSFDGGHEQSFRIRYKLIKSDYSLSTSILTSSSSGLGSGSSAGSILSSLGSSSSSSVDQIKLASDYFYAYPPTGSTVFTLNSLNPASEYIVTISSRNKLGESLISREFVRVRTLSVPIVIDRDNPLTSVVATVAGERKSTSEIKLVAGMGTTLLIVIILIGGSIGCLTISWATLIYYKRHLPFVSTIQPNDSCSSTSNSTAFTPNHTNAAGGGGGYHHHHHHHHHTPHHHHHNGGDNGSLGKKLGQQSTIINPNSSIIQGIKCPSELTTHDSMGNIVEPAQGNVIGCGGGDGGGGGITLTDCGTNIDVGGGGGGGFVTNCSTNIPFVISSNTMGICKCTDNSTAIPLMVIDEKISIADLDDKCYSFQNKDYESKLMASIVDGGQQPDILMNQIKELVNHAVCCENGYKLAESCDGNIHTVSTLRRIPRVNIIDGEYSLTTVPEEEMEEIL